MRINIMVRPVLLINYLFNIYLHKKILDLAPYPLVNLASELISQSSLSSGSTTSVGGLIPVNAYVSSKETLLRRLGILP